AEQPNRQLVEIFKSEIPNFSKYKLAKAYVRWTRSHAASDLSITERVQWTTLVEKINASFDEPAAPPQYAPRRPRASGKQAAATGAAQRATYGPRALSVQFARGQATGCGEFNASKGCDPGSTIAHGCRRPRAPKLANSEAPALVLLALR